MAVLPPTIRYLYDFVKGRASIIVVKQDSNYEVTINAKGKINDSLQKFIILDTINAKGEIQDSVSRIKFLSDTVSGKATVTIETGTGIISAKGEIQDSIEKIDFVENISAKGVIIDSVVKRPSPDKDEGWTKQSPPETNWDKA